jgi:hypothetical protein
MPTNFERAFEERPNVYAAWRGLVGAIQENMELRRYELATFAAAQRLGSTYCSIMHGNVLRNELGEDVLAIANDREETLDPVDLAVMDLAERVVVDATSIDEAGLQRLRNLGLTDDEIMDVVLAAAARCFFSKTLGRARRPSRRPLPGARARAPGCVRGRAPDRRRLEGELYAEPCAAVARAVDGEPPIERRDAVREAAQPGAGRRVGASLAVVLDDDDQRTLRLAHTDCGTDRRGVLRDVVQRLADDVVRGDADVRVERRRRDVELDRDRRARRDDAERRGEPALAERGRMDPLRELAELLDGGREFRDGAIDSRGSARSSRSSSTARAHARALRSVPSGWRPTSWPAALGDLRGAPLREPRQSVVRDRLPRCRVRDELAVLGPHAGIGVEQAEADSHRRRRGIAAPERASARAAEALRPPVCRRPLAHELLARDEMEGASVDANLGGRSRAGPAQAPRAVAVGGVAGQRSVHLEADAAAITAARHDERGHRASLDGPPDPR